MQDVRRRGHPERAARLAPPEEIADLAIDHLGALVGLDPAWIVRSATPGLERLTDQPVTETIGSPLRSLLSRETADATIEALAQAVQAATRVPVPGVLAGNRAVTFVPTPRAAPSAEIYVVVTDMVPMPRDRDLAPTTEQFFRTRLVEVEERLVEAGLLAEAAAELAASLDPADILRRIAEHAARLCRAESAALDLLDESLNVLTVAVVGGPAGRPVEPSPVPPDNTVAGRALATGRVIELSGEEAARQAARYVGESESRAATTVLAVPLSSDGTALGALVLARRSGVAFEPAAIYRARELGRRAASAIINARRHAALRRELVDLRESQARVVQAEKMAALGKLGAGAAHEINNPLAAIVGNAELLLRREPLTVAGQERVERILQSAYRAARVIRQLLASVRAQSPELAATDLVGVLRHAVETRAQDLALDGVQVVDELTPLPIVQADASQLDQAFANLLDNAIDAVRTLAPGEGRIIRLVSRAPAGRVRLRIENTGQPIADETLARIFDPFFTTKPVGKGIGLGLSVAQGIVGAHGGRLSAENLTHGVAMVIDLPVSGASDETTGTRPAA